MAISTTPTIIHTAMMYMAPVTVKTRQGIDDLQFSSFSEPGHTLIDPCSAGFSISFVVRPPDSSIWLRHSFCLFVRSLL